MWLYIKEINVVRKVNGNNVICVFKETHKYNRS